MSHFILYVGILRHSRDAAPRCVFLTWMVVCCCALYLYLGYLYRYLYRYTYLYLYLYPVICSFEAFFR